MHCVSSCLKVLLGLSLIACQEENISKIKTPPKYLIFRVFDPESLFDIVTDACGVPHTATS